MTDRVLVLAAPFGSGHVAAAEAIAQACRDRSSLGGEARAVTVSNGMLQALSDGYLRLLQFAPSAYRNLYHAPVSKAMRQFVRSMLLSTVQAEIRRYQPTAIIATHPFPGAVAGYLRQKGRLSIPVAMALTDFAPHPLWVHPGVDRYFVASPEVALGLTAQGVDSASIRVTGIPVGAAFGNVRGHVSGKRVLVMGGGLGLGPIQTAVQSLINLAEPDLQIAVVCGSNQSLQQEITARFGFDQRLTVFGYTNQVAKLMSQADLLVSKPGGLTCSEAMACDLPTLLLRPLPGHEEENAAYLTRTGAALIADEHDVGTLAHTLLSAAPERLVYMRERARLAGRPAASQNIADDILLQSQTNLYRTANVS